MRTSIRWTATDLIQLTADPRPGTLNERYPVYSPDGKSIAFTSARNGVTQVWIMDLATRTQRRLTNGAATERSLSWSPDGQFIAVHSADATGVGIAITTVTEDKHGVVRPL